MKKLLFILFISISFSLFGQKQTFDITNIAGSDTTLFYYLYGSNTTVVIDFTNFNAATATIDIGFTLDKLGFVSEPSGTSYPLTLDTSTITKTSNGQTTHRLMYINCPTKCYLCIKLTPVDVTVGTLKIWY